MVLNVEYFMYLTFLGSLVLRKLVKRLVIISWGSNLHQRVKYFTDVYSITLQQLTKVNWAIFMYLLICLDFYNSKLWKNNGLWSLKYSYFLEQNTLFYPFTAVSVKIKIWCVEHCILFCIDFEAVTFFQI